MKKILFSAIFAAMTTIALAVPAKPGVWKTITLVDGTQVKVELRGDEFVSFWQAEDGRKFVRQGSEPYFVEADMQHLLTVAAAARQQSPLPVRGESEPVTRIGIGDSHPAFVGTKKGLIILAEFTDKKFVEGHDAEYYSHIANDADFSHSDGFVGSIHDYFHAQSGGQFDLTFDVVGPIELQHEVEYYGAHNGDAVDSRAPSMIVEAVQGAVQTITDFSEYDWFGDGYVDQVFVIYAGRGEADGGDENTIWPHRSDIWPTRNFGGKKVKTYACSNELQDGGNGKEIIDGIGAFCHEFSHCLGLPDLYDTSYSGNYGMSAWDIMHWGCYLDKSFRPCGYSGYEKNYCGWQEPIILTDDTEVTDLKGISEGGDYYIIYNDAYLKEYYILENRTKKGWDADLYGSGLLITHIDFDSFIWAYNLVNTTGDYNDHQRYTLFPADNSVSNTSVHNDLYPYKTNNQLTNYSVPASILYHKNPDGELYMSKPITDITKNADGTVSFKFAAKEAEKEPLPEGTFFIETFDKCEGTGGNDGKWGSTASLSNILCDNLGWDIPVGGGANQCVAIGSTSSNDQAIAKSPEFTISEPAVLTFKAGIDKVGASNEITVTVKNNNKTLSQTTFTITEKSKWNEFSAEIAAESYPVKIKLEFANGKKRTFLDEICVKIDETSDINIPIVDKDSTLPCQIYTLDGRYVGNDINQISSGVYVVNGKKVITFRR